MELNGNMGIMLTKDELALEQSQHDASDDVLNIRVMLHSIHSDDGNPISANIKQAPRQLKNIKKYDYESFQDEERYEHVGPKVTRAQEGNLLQDDEEMMYD
ncbi:hypothetical protein Tco_0606951 [Tanacetum coccineum]